jgi:hypothetical protein
MVLYLLKEKNQSVATKLAMKGFDFK